VIVSLDGDPNKPSTFNGTFSESFSGSANGSAGVPLAPMLPLPNPPPTVLTSANLVREASGPGGAVVTYVAATATDPNNGGLALGVTCLPASGSSFPVGDTLVTCTSALDSGVPPEEGIGRFNVKVQDTTPPTLIGGDIEVQATDRQTPVPFAVTANDSVDGNGKPVTTCSRDSGSLFPVGSTPVTCTYSDAAGNAALPLTFTVTVKVEPPAIGEGCFIVNFREITYFKGSQVIMSSDADIRARNLIAGDFNPLAWPYPALTKSRGTRFRIYGFQPAEHLGGVTVPDADDPFASYPVQKHVEGAETLGYYIDMGGPARVIICANQLHNYVLAGLKRNGHRDGSTLLPVGQRNVPGIMLTHNSQILKLPKRVKAEMAALSLPLGVLASIDYIGFQLQGNGSALYREFVDVEVEFPNDSDTDGAVHFASGFHTATNTNFETFAGCSYYDYAPGNDAVRLHDVWGPNKSRLPGYQSAAACGSREPALPYNQKVRANYEVPYNAVQILPTVNTNTDTLRLFYGTIRPVTLADIVRRLKEIKLDWAEWDRFDH
jgi:HYR domain-containing protein